jgi:hypothetical protein
MTPASRSSVRSIVEMPVLIFLISEVEIEITPPGGVNLRAFEMIFRMTCPKRLMSTDTLTREKRSGICDGPLKLRETFICFACRRDRRRKRESDEVFQREDGRIVNLDMKWSDTSLQKCLHIDDTVIQFHVTGLKFIVAEDIIQDLCGCLATQEGVLKKLNDRELKLLAWTTIRRRIVEWATRRLLEKASA